MRIHHTVCVLTVFLLAGCKQLEGTYYPGCVAFEGDRVVLQDDRVTWDRFTDQIIVDGDGNTTDPFPEYPKTGRYDVDGDLLHLHFEGDDIARSLHIRRHDDRVLLLNAQEFADWQRTGEYNSCILTLAPEEVP